MKILRYGASGAQVAFLQTALERAGEAVGAADGIFGERTRAAVTAFQRRAGLTPDGIAGARTHRALEMWYLGYAVHTVRSGDTLFSIARRYDSTLRAVEIANPGLDPTNLRVGSRVRVPLPFPVVPEGIPIGSGALEYIVRGIAGRYPFVTADSIGASVLGAPLHRLYLGGGARTVFYNAAHHANEWITVPVLLRFAEELSRAYAYDASLFGVPAREILETATIHLVPCVNPDGVDLVVGDLNAGAAYEEARRLSRNYPDIAFPRGWKANIRGVDLNLQYPAGWEEARSIKFAQGYTQPGPRDYVGEYPLSEPESRAMYDLTRRLSPAMILAYHTQGEVIFWRYLDFDPPGARALGERFAEVSGYALEDTPYASGYAGYKDWFIQDFNRPGYTIEAGEGTNPLPIGQFGQIYADNLGILVTAALGR